MLRARPATGLPSPLHADDRTIADYLIERAADRPVGAIAAAPAEKGVSFTPTILRG